eukprot:5506558-Pleurochrysis_carterae.AAC.1
MRRSPRRAPGPRHGEVGGVGAARVLKRRLGVEAPDKVGDAHLEVLDVLLDLLLLQALQRAEHLARVERRLLGVLPLEGRALEPLEHLVGHVDVVPLEQRDGVAQRVEHAVRLLLVDAHVAHVRHGRDELRRVVLLHLDRQALVDARHKLEQIVDLLDNVLLQVVGVRVGPLGDPRLQLALDGAGVDLEPALQVLRRQRLDLLLKRLVVRDLGVEHGEVGAERAFLARLHRLGQVGLER